MCVIVRIIVFNYSDLTFVSSDLLVSSCDWINECLILILHAVRQVEERPPYTYVLEHAFLRPTRSP